MDGKITHYGSLVVSNNTVLTDMNGFNGLKQVPLSMSVAQNPALETISGLTKLAVVQQS